MKMTSRIPLSETLFLFFCGTTPRDVGAAGGDLPMAPVRCWIGQHGVAVCCEIVSFTSLSCPRETPLFIYAQCHRGTHHMAGYFGAPNQGTSLSRFANPNKIIAQLLSERLIPFVALDVRSDRVAVGRALDLPVYFGDAGSREVLHKVGADRACAAAITLDTPGANYRAVWALSKYFPNVKTFVRAHDVDHGVNLEKAGASAVVPETLEPSLQLAAAVLAEAKLPMSEIAATINEFRNRHLSELTELCSTSGNSLGYGFSRVMSKTKPLISDDESESADGALAI